MTCQELEERVTAYLEGGLPPDERDIFEAHLRGCRQCSAYLSQVRQTVAALGQLRPSGPSSADPRTLELFRTRGLHASPPHVRDIPLGLGNDRAARGDHIAYLWESEGDFEAIAGFLAAGLSLGEACVLVGHDAPHALVLAGLERRGLSVRSLTDEGQLQVVPVSSAGGGPLLEIDRRIKQAVDRGMPTVRVLGNLNWGRGTPGWPSDREILQLEAQVTMALERLPSIVVCAYDVARLPGSMLVKGGFECHGLTYRRNSLRPNELHVPPARFLRELSPP
jgi:DcmR-like sensory protein/putative zinc finger protein